MRSGPGSTARGWGLTFGLLILLAAVLGCGDAQKRYRILSFFFDGVPDPSAPNTTVTRRSGASGRPVFLHKPYADKSCDKCHQSSGGDIFARTRVRPDVCGECHRNVLGEHRVMHGPVEAEQCLMCHSPHQSTEAHLLKAGSPRLCDQCHERSSLASSVPQHLEPKADCLSCHFGHGGEDRNFLRVTQAFPTTATTQAGSGGSEARQ